VPHKYHAVKTRGYDSKREANRATELHYMQQMGIISDLQEQVKYEVIPKMGPNRAAHYILDFQYIDCTTGLTHHEDSKGYKTPEYILKKKLMLVVHGILIEEV